MPLDNERCIQFGVRTSDLSNHRGYPNLWESLHLSLRIDLITISLYARFLVVDFCYKSLIVELQTDCECAKSVIRD